jgi:hypothetical protein
MQTWALVHRRATHEPQQRDLHQELKIDTTGVTGDELSEPFNALLPAARHYAQCSTRPGQRASDTAHPRDGLNSHHGGQGNLEPATAGHMIE